jgi:hypothetical protein
VTDSALASAGLLRLFDGAQIPLFHRQFNSFGVRGDDGIRDDLAASAGGRDDDCGGDQDKVLDDVLTFEGRKPGKVNPGFMAQYEEWQEGSRHLEEKQEDRRAKEAARQKAKSDRALPHREKMEQHDGSDVVKRKHDENPLGELIDGEGDGVKLQRAEPQKDESERDSEMHQSMGGKRLVQAMLRMLESQERSADKYICEAAKRGWGDTWGRDGGCRGLGIEHGASFVNGRNVAVLPSVI